MAACEALAGFEESHALLTKMGPVTERGAAFPCASAAVLPNTDALLSCGDADLGQDDRPGQSKAVGPDVGRGGSK